MLELSVAGLIGLSFGYLNALSTGGGFIVVPGLTALGLAPATAFGTARLASLGAGVSAAYQYFKRGQIVRRHLGLFITLSLIAGALGPHLILRLDGRLVSRTLGVLFLLLLPLVLRSRSPTTSAASPKRRSTLVGFGLLFIVLLYQASFGVGSGILLIYLLSYFFNMNAIQANATCTVFGQLGGIAVLLTYIAAGAVNYTIALPLLLGAATGGYLGARTALKWGADRVKWLLAIIIIISAIKFIIWPA